MKRKVIQHGPVTLTVSLPFRWVKSHNISKGDELNVEEEGRVLRVYSGDAHLLSNKTSANFSGLDVGTINSILAVLHKSGYDEINITFDSPQIVKMIQDRINSMLIGYEIIEQKGDSCTVKNISGDHISEIDALIRRTFLVSLSLANNSLEEIKSGSKARLRELLILERTNNKLVNYCQRLLNKSPYKDAKTIYTYVIMWLIESICDDYRDLIETIASKPHIKVSGSFLGLLGEVNGLLSQYYDLFYNYSDEKLSVIRAAYEPFRSKILRMKADPDERILNHYLLSIANRIADCLGSTVGLHH